MGFAWHYTYYSKDKKMTLLESLAKKKKIGLWSAPNSINPYNWRIGELENWRTGELENWRM